MGLTIPQDPGAAVAFLSQEFAALRESQRRTLAMVERLRALVERELRDNLHELLTCPENGQSTGG